MSNLSRQIHYSRLVFFVLASIFAVSIVVQVFIAGLAIFTNYSYWTYHTIFVVFFQFIPIPMMVLSFIGHFPKSIRWQVAGLFLLIVPLQYVSVNVPGMGAIHPVIALVLFWLAVNVVKKAGNILRGTVS